ncbi:hypothetical protein P3102_22110 [Amycolatopsis sp. QT-25]|uniref:VC0807 family protein n=1 Tax=Amycolatopsis sp. QT-25 TaxID=3034022 RepID=UPI0023EABA22|nr:VC0807 family protein [Amycolatopsis sp. QT-25]WET76802.1 hypothetical protein P3102_22110 [Amycolatopsis sp. QT-25]
MAHAVEQDRERQQDPKRGSSSSWRTIAWTLLLDVALPFACYVVLLLFGVHEAAALAAAGGIAFLRAVVIWIRERQLGALSILLTVRFFLGVLAALITGDARFVLAKDSLVTAAVGLGVLASLVLAKPAIYFIRRSLSPRKAAFGRQWKRSADFRRLNRKMTWVWGIGLLGEATARIGVIYLLPLNVAAFLSQTMAALAIVALVGWTQWRGRRSPVDPEG